MQLHERTLSIVIIGIILGLKKRLNEKTRLFNRYKANETPSWINALTWRDYWNDREKNCSNSNKSIVFEIIPYVRYLCLRRLFVFYVMQVVFLESIKYIRIVVTFIIIFFFEPTRKSSACIADCISKQQNYRFYYFICTVLRS